LYISKKINMKNLILILLFAGFYQLRAQTIPQATVVSPEGKSYAFEKLVSGDKPVIVSFWATWCVPCIKELNEINEFYPQWKKETGARMIAISIDNNRNAQRIPAFIKRQGWNFEVYHDKNMDLAKAYKIYSIPYMLIFKNGEIIFENTGYIQGMSEDIYDIIKE